MTEERTATSLAENEAIALDALSSGKVCISMSGEWYNKTLKVGDHMDGYGEVVGVRTSIHADSKEIREDLRGKKRMHYTIEMTLAWYECLTDGGRRLKVVQHRAGDNHDA